MAYRDYLPREVLRLLIRAYEEAYETSQQSISPEEGDDGFVFGVMVWRRAINRIAYYAEQYGVACSLKNNHVQILLANGSLRPYPGGKDPIDETSKLRFRQDSQAKVELVAENTEQLSLFRDFPRVNLILVHVGNADHGLRELWIGAPYFDEQEDLVGWSEPEKIYDSADPIPQELLDQQPFHQYRPFNQREEPNVDIGPRRNPKRRDDPRSGSDH